MKKLDLKHKANHILVTGASGTGKSTFIEKYVREESKQEKIFIFDPENEFSVRFGDDADIVTDIRDLGNDEFGAIVIYAPPQDSDMKIEFDDFCAWVFEFSVNYEGGVLLVLDELQEYVTPDNLPPDFRKCITRGRRYNLDMLYISQAPNLLHNCIRTQTTEAVAFSQADELAVKFNKQLGFDGEEIMALPDLDYYRKKIKISAAPKKSQIKFDN